jgi:hypothetical protein
MSAVLRRGCGGFFESLMHSVTSYQLVRRADRPSACHGSLPIPDLRRHPFELTSQVEGVCHDNDMCVNVAFGIVQVPGGHRYAVTILARHGVDYWGGNNGVSVERAS